jgi:outer membrane protein OmpA-like peptidoglycan-associated protein
MKVLWTLLAVALLTWSCATKKYVNQEVDAAETRTASQIRELQAAVEETQTEIRDLAEELNLTIEGLEGTTQDLGRIAEDNAQMIVQMGQLRFQKTLSEAQANYKSDSAELTDGAKEELDKFARLLLEQNKMAQIEIQGHTDNRGSLDYNMKLGLERAEAVRDYLYKRHDIPLHLMSVISFGPDRPIADNGDREGRSKNRRVVLVVRVQI